MSCTGIASRRLSAVRRRRLREIQKVVRRLLFIKHRGETRGVGGLFLTICMDGNSNVASHFSVRSAMGSSMRIFRSSRSAKPYRSAIASVSSSFITWTLCRIRSGLRPRHAVRIAVGRTHRIDIDVAAAARAFRVCVHAAALQRGSEPVRLPQAARLAFDLAFRPHRVQRIELHPLARFAAPAETADRKRISRIGSSCRLFSISTSLIAEVTNAPRPNSVAEICSVCERCPTSSVTAR